MMKWVFLTIAIVAEVIGTSALKYSEGFTKLLPTLGVVICYLISFYFLSLTLKYMPVGIAYAIWAGLGTVLIILVSYFAFRQKLDFPAVVGLILIVLGVVVINVFSKSTSH